MGKELGGGRRNTILKEGGKGEEELLNRYIELVEGRVDRVEERLIG